MSNSSKLDTYVVELLKHNFDEVNQQRIDAEKASAEDYQQFIHPSS